MKINTHGYKMIGLRKAAGETKGLKGYYSGHYVQLSYNKVTGKILTDYHCSFGQNSWTQYHNSNIIGVGNMSQPKTMQEIADLIADAMTYHQES